MSHTQFPIARMAALATCGLLVALAAPPAIGVIGNSPLLASSHEHRAEPQKVMRAKDGLFYLPATAAGHSVQLLVDTGANRVVLTRRDARAIGVDIDRLHYHTGMETAAGRVRVASTLLDGLEIGGRRFDHVAILVTDREEGVSLLGQDLLTRIGTLVMNGDGMRLHHLS
jgi:aspartyl protease family protein